jgi:phage-related protein
VFYSILFPVVWGEPLGIFFPNLVHITTALRTVDEIGIFLYRCGVLMINRRPPAMRSLVWMGNSLQNLQAFPREAQKLLGDEIQLIQFGGMPKDGKPYTGVGSGVTEIALRYNTNSYRAVLAVQLGQKIYVLHAFLKKSVKGKKHRSPIKS